MNYKLYLVIIATLLLCCVPAVGLSYQPRCFDLQTSEIGKALIKHYEGLALRAYVCPGGVNTIGWGNTSHARPGRTITKEIAEQYLTEDLRRFERDINRHSERQLKWHEFDALASFEYNCGYKFRNRLKDAVNKNMTAKACYYLRQFVHAKGKRLKGLERRRESECKLYEFGVLNYEL
jgi:lysozyme